MTLALSIGARRGELRALRRRTVIAGIDGSFEDDNGFQAHRGLKMTPRKFIEANSSAVAFAVRGTILHTATTDRSIG